MSTLSENAKQELFRALEGKQSVAFVVNGKLVSVEIDENEKDLNELPHYDLAKEIEEDSELKDSLTRYLNSPNMKRYSGTELKEKRRERRS
ncbi:hypothetical protein RRV45_05135 [Bacillus sp. DTU_2020_1000418_1_SI_GHA_SEK_038]|uniref:hypothetical protein n=1 Tax=Bacillus sp. DTU_2020_1000418_1_SI_GHA_SEK_038 TaxID=3077585 RepID=UPI0028E8D12F|nr:hypothetical protein [Bacillus sp. DTU_2020_1000418_1_SI_GHA_SEK_038]WNS76397.1 hypothetical protein RRV45_05135 [Bacillus sp. DTU_2020_1000418_1_SI_GHA_SEK_038]